MNLLMPIPELYCRQLRKAKHEGIIGDVAIAILTFSSDFYDGDTGDDEILIEIMCTMTNNEIRKICATYQQTFGKRLEQGIREDKTGNFKKLLVILAAADRDESANIDLVAAKFDAEALKKNLSKAIPDEKPIVELLSKKSFAHIRLIADEYKTLCGSSLEKAIKRNFSDNIKDAFVAIIRTSNGRAEYYARRVNRAINNFLLDDRSLGRLIVVRCEIDLMDVKDEFNRIFRKSIKSSLKGEISGSYKHALLTLLGEN